MRNRIKEIRRDLGLTQSEFASRISMKQNSIAQIELGKRIPSTLAIQAICREFGISQLWLEEGIEPKYIDQDEADIEVINRIMEGQSENKKELMRIIANMPDELLDAFIDYLKKRYSI